MLQSLIQSVLSGVGLGILFALPLVALGWLLYRRRLRYRAQAEEPFTDMPLRPPGESLRSKIEELNDQYDEALTGGMLACVAGLAIASGTPASQKLAVGGTALLLAIAACCAVGRRMFKAQRQLWDTRLGFAGERVTGEALNQLLADGFKVFHDLPFDGFNIDHVIVGPPGVYAVETKTRRKPADIKGLPKAIVYYDGAILRFPRFEETKPIEQARLNAKTLSKWLTQSTGENTTVDAMVVIPGWWVERTGRSDVNVLNPKEIARSFPSWPAAPLAPDRIQRIVYQLTERCRLARSV